MKLTSTTASINASADSAFWTKTDTSTGSVLESCAGVKTVTMSEPRISRARTTPPSAQEWDGDKIATNKAQAISAFTAWPPVFRASASVEEKPKRRPHKAPPQRKSTARPRGSEGSTHEQRATRCRASAATRRRAGASEERGWSHRSFQPATNRVYQTNHRRRAAIPALRRNNPPASETGNARPTLPLPVARAPGKSGRTIRAQGLSHA